MSTERTPWPKPKKRVRLGDAVAVIAQPIAKFIDRHLGTDIEHCGGCAARRKKWNGDT